MIQPRSCQCDQEKKSKDDCQCALCLSWFGAWQDIGLEDPEFQWKMCEGCDGWFCPSCVTKKLLELHEAPCKAEKQPGRRGEGGKMQGNPKRKRTSDREC